MRDKMKDDGTGPIIFYLQKSIQTMTTLYHEDKRRTGDESEKFFSLLTPILRQVDNLRIHEDHCPSVLYSILADDAREACDDINKSEARLKYLLYQLNKKVLFGKEIKGRRMVSWPNVSID